jgi:hypothetical protein
MIRNYVSDQTTALRCVPQVQCPLKRVRIVYASALRSHLQVERRRNVGLLHLGSQGQARHGQQLRHPSLVFLKW